MANDTVTRDVIVDIRLSAYQSFYDHRWAKEFYAVVGGTALAEAGLDLCAAWKGAANARRMPWLMMHSLKKALEDFASTHRPFPLQVLDGVLKRLGAGYQRPDLGLAKGLRRKLGLAIREAEADVTERLRNSPLNLDMNPHWDQLLTLPDFSIALWKSEEMAYVAVYYAYEDFLTRAVAATMGEPDYRWRRLNDFCKDFRASFGEDLEKKCLTDEPLQIARLSRHSVVHNGGRLTNELRRYGKQLVVQDGTVVVMAAHTTELFKVLKDRALALARHASTMPSLTHR